MKNILYIVLISFVTAFSNCTFEVVEKPQPKDVGETDGTTRFAGISDSTVNTIPVDAGEIGIGIDTRLLAVRGYKPTTVNVSIGGDLSALSQNNIEVDDYTHMALFKIKRENLSADQIFLFSEGVAIEASVYDAQNNLIETESNTKFIISGSNRTLTVETEKPRLFQAIKFNPNVPHYILYNNRYLGGNRINFSSKSYDNIFIVSTLFRDSPNSDHHKIQQFYFIPLGDDVYAIKTAFKNCYLELYDGVLRWNANYSDDNGAVTLEDKHKFKFEGTRDGQVKIRPANGSDFFKQKWVNIYGYHQAALSNTLSTAEDLALNVVAANITWQYEDLGTEYSAAIVPPAQMDFAFDQTIHNCSGATGQYFVGNNQTETKTVLIGMQESANLYSSQTDSKSATISASANGTVFGVGVSVSASGTLSNSNTTAFGQSKTNSSSTSYTETEKVSSNRKITVPPYTSVEVFDVIQKFKYVRIPFVQRTLLRGTDDIGIPLTGPEIETQLLANGFNGVILEVGSDYIEFSVRGSVGVSNYFEYKNTVNDIKGICGN
ncbi:hypothetical protein [Labilibacter marinus]|uniref:hypothetical protein n=1 Tax=Labilibacter marinus TaxID=1477105 RepID=UPI00082CAAF2|nr:hypothetical protein [Labilibacter marinus]